MGIVVGFDSALWFTNNGASKVDRIATAGLLTEYPVPTPASFPLGIASGPDGSLWFTEFGGNKIGRITNLDLLADTPVLNAGIPGSPATVAPTRMCYPAPGVGLCAAMRGHP